jgi:hypothetical protein
MVTRIPVISTTVAEMRTVAVPPASRTPLDLYGVAVAGRL